MSDELGANQLGKMLERSELDAVFVDVLATGGRHGDIVNLTLGSFVYPPTGVADVLPACRLRMTVGLATVLRDFLSAAISAEPSAHADAPPSNAKLN